MVTNRSTIFVSENDDAGKYLLEHPFVGGKSMKTSNAAKGIPVHMFMQLGVPFSMVVWDYEHFINVKYDDVVFFEPFFIIPRDIKYVQTYKMLDEIVAVWDRRIRARFLLAVLENGHNISYVDLIYAINTQDLKSNNYSVMTLLELGCFDSLNILEFGHLWDLTDCPTIYSKVHQRQS